MDNLKLLDSDQAGEAEVYMGNLKEKPSPYSKP